MIDSRADAIVGASAAFVVVNALKRLLGERAVGQETVGGISVSERLSAVEAGRSHWHRFSFQRKRPPDSGLFLFTLYLQDTKSSE